MKKIYDCYLKCKNEDNSKLYLFESGNFFIFVGDDAEYITKITPLNKAKYNNNVYKCGFPKKSLDRYMSIFKELNLDVSVIYDERFDDDKFNKFLSKISSVNIDLITPIEALNYLKELKELL